MDVVDGSTRLAGRRCCQLASSWNRCKCGPLSFSDARFPSAKGSFRLHHTIHNAENCPRLAAVRSFVDGDETMEMPHDGTVWNLAQWKLLVSGLGWSPPCRQARATRAASQ